MQSHKENRDRFRTSKDSLGVPDPAKTFDALSPVGTVDSVPKDVTITLNHQELAAVLAGLRMLQEKPTQFWGPIHDIISDGDFITPLSKSGIGDLAEKINLS